MEAFSDPYWNAAAQASFDALHESRYVLVPEDFLPLHPRFLPLEYAWGLHTERLAWCCVKDDVDRLAPSLLASNGNDVQFYRWANEVFVLGANFPWAEQADSESRRHLCAWFERLERYRSGIPARASAVRLPASSGVDLPPSPDVAGTAAAAQPRVLIVGASNMGNVGDDLLADVLASLCSAMGAAAHFSGPDIDPLHLVHYDAVIVGGGGLIYASRDGADEAQNLANYLKFGALCSQLDIPVALIGVGDQEQRTPVAVSGLFDSDSIIARFARESLQHFKSITTRDADSTDLLIRLGAADCQTGADLLFLWRDRAEQCIRPTATLRGRIALSGELYSHPSVAHVLDKQAGGFARAAADRDFDLLVMSNDDIAHVMRTQSALRRVGASASIVDLRDHDFDSLIYLFSSYDCVVTTRFHGLVLAILSNVPAIALDHESGKCSRLLHEIDALESLLLVGQSAAAIDARLEQALAGHQRPIDRDAAQRLSSKAEVHRKSLGALLHADMPQRVESNTAPPKRPCRNLRKRSLGALSVSLAESGPIPLSWAASSGHTAGHANLGDSLSAVVVAALSGRAVKHVHFDADTTKMVAIGSIGHAIRHGTAVVWGAGVSIRAGILPRNIRCTSYDIHAVRGPISAQHYRDFGLKVPDVYGDPAWILPSIVDEPVEQEYELGIIPHIHDVASPHPKSPPKPDSLRWFVGARDASSIAVINTWHHPTWSGLLAKLRLIRSCKRIVSQSFHGLVIAEAYGIPALNLRALPGEDAGPVRVNLASECRTDPRVWELYKGGGRESFWTYNQRRTAHTDWEDVIRAIDRLWQPFEYDAAPLIEAFPLPLAYNPLYERVSPLAPIKELRF